MTFWDGCRTSTWKYKEELDLMSQIVHEFVLNGMKVDGLDARFACA
jgi:hypothetical protein